MKCKWIFLFSIILMVVGTIQTVSAAYLPQWQDEPDIPVASAGSISYKDKIYVFGGIASDGSYSSAVQIYDTNTGVWSYGNSMPVGTQSSGYLEHEGIVYIIGGMTSASTITNQVITYNIELDTWEDKEPKPTACSNFKAEFHNGKIYTFGGAPAPGKDTNVTEVYDIRLDQWSTLTPMPGNRYSYASECIGDYIYIIGGRQLGIIGLNTVIVYDVMNDSWKTMDSSIPFKYGGSASIKFNNTIYCMGGRQNNQSAVDTIYKYDTVSDTWTLLPLPLTSARYASSLVIAGGRIFILGGFDNDRNTMQSIGLAEFVSMDKLFVLLDPGEQCQASLTHNLSDNNKYNWSSIDSTIASVDSNGLITARFEGKTYILCTSNDGSYEDYIPVKVREGAGEIRLAVHLENIGDSEALWLSDTELVTWHSLGTTVADVDSNGVVTATGGGLTIIEGMVNGIPYHIYVRVNATA